MAKFACGAFADNASAAGGKKARLFAACSARLEV
jgi:hypothetical protein